MPPSIEELRRRLEGRATDSPEVIEKRIAKAESEIGHSEQFYMIIVNNVLADAVAETEKAVLDFTSHK